MADTFRNPYNYTSPIGAALADLTRTIISGPSQAEKIKAAEAMRLAKAQADAAIRENEAIAKLGDIFGTYGTDGFDRSSAMRSAILGGYDPADLAEMERYGSANLFGAMDPRTTNAFVGAGGAYSSTGAGFTADQTRQREQAAASLAETARHNQATEGIDIFKFQNTPYEAVGPDGPQVFTNLTAVGQPALVSEAEQKGYLLGQNFDNLSALDPLQQTVLGARGTGNPVPRNYVLGDRVYVTYDGVTDAQTGEALPPGGIIQAGEGALGDKGITTSTQTSLEGAKVAIDRAGKMLDYVEGLVMKDPTNFGATGWVKGMGQDIGQLAQNIATGLGYTGLQEAIAGIQQDAAANGVDQNVIARIFNFDPSLGELQGAYGMLVYSLASGIAGQEGRELSDADVQRAVAAFGNPQAFFASQQSVLAKIKAARTMLGINKGVVEGALGGGQPAPADAPVQITDDAQYEALPPGTKFIAPDGTTRVKP